VSRISRTIALAVGFWGVAALAAVALAPAAASVPARVAIGSAPRPAAGSTVVGSLPNTARMNVTVTLRPRDPAALTAYASEVSTPGSIFYHHYLTVSQFAAAFGPTAAQTQAVVSALRAQGLRPGTASANGLAIPVSATAGQVASAFSVKFHRFALPSGRTAFANTSAPLLDTSVAGFVQGVVGLSTLVQPKPLGLTVAHGVVAHVTPHVVTGGPQPCSAASGVGEYTADQLASAYRFSSLYGAGDEGAGQTVALYELEPDKPSDISAYQSCYGTSASVSYVKVDSGSGSGAGEGEAALDIEDVIGLAPKASILVYQGPNSGSGAYDTYNSIISQDKAKVISTSWGLCESSEGSSAASSENTLFQEAATQGQSIYAAAGDSGSEDCGTNSLAVDDPASQPYVTGVGGTTLSALGPPPAQTVWADDTSSHECGGGSCGGGGGISSLWSMPSYQSGAPSSLNVINSGSSGSPCQAAGGSYCREVPDVSADADPYTGYSIYYDGQWTGIGGTSAAAPLWAAFTALTNSSSACNGTPIGFANPVLYKAAGSAYSSDFSDVTSGNNDITHTNGGKFAAGTGYDMASGLGTPIGSALSSTLCGGGGGGGTTPTVTVTNPGSQTGTVGTAVSVQIHASDSDGGALTYGATGLPAGLSINSSTGLITGTPTTAASSSVTVTATDSSGPSGTASFTWTISAASGSCTAAQLLGNPNFATGSAAPWTTTADVVVPASDGEAGYGGAQYVAWLDGYNDPHTDTLAQAVAIPAGCPIATFSFYLHIDTTQTGSTVHDTLNVQVLSSSGSVLGTLATFSNANAASGYTQHSYSLSAYAGQTITLKFTGTETTRKETSFVVSDTGLNVS